MCSKVPFISSAIMKATDSGMYLWLTAITIMTVLSSSFFLFLFNQKSIKIKMATYMITLMLLLLKIQTVWEFDFSLETVSSGFGFCWIGLAILWRCRWSKKTKHILVVGKKATNLLHVICILELYSSFFSEFWNSTIGWSRCRRTMPHEAEITSSNLL